METMSDDSDDDSQVSGSDSSQAEPLFDPTTGLCLLHGTAECFACMRALWAAAEEARKAAENTAKALLKIQETDHQPETLPSQNSFDNAFDEPPDHQALHSYNTWNYQAISNFSLEELFGFAELLVRTDCVVVQQVVNAYHGALMCQLHPLKPTKSLPTLAHMRFALGYWEWLADPSHPVEYIPNESQDDHRMVQFYNLRAQEYAFIKTDNSDLRKYLLKSGMFYPCDKCQHTCSDGCRPDRVCKHEWSPSCPDCHKKRRKDLSTRVAYLKSIVTEVFPEEISNFAGSHAGMAIVGSLLYRYKRLFPNAQNKIHNLFRPLFRKHELPEILSGPDHDEIIDAHGHVVSEFIKRAGDPVSAGDGKKTVYATDDEVMAILYVLSYF